MANATKTPNDANLNNQNVSEELALEELETVSGGTDTLRVASSSPTPLIGLLLPAVQK